MFLPAALGISDRGQLTIGRREISQLAEQYGTPLMIMDEDDIRSHCREFTGALKRHYPGAGTIAHASKAFTCLYMARIAAEEGMGLDTVSAGELYTAMKAGFPMDRVCFHGNNKTESEIDLCLTQKIRRIVVDNAEELETIQRMAKERGLCPEISFRIKPGIDAHTHEFVQTGNIDSKFGFALETGEALDILRRAAKMSHVKPVGLHCHIGSQIFDPEPFAHAVSVMMAFYAELCQEYGLPLFELNLGGGFGIAYTQDDDPRSIDEVVSATAHAVQAECARYQLPLPHLVLEPGRSITATSGVTVYTVGSVKRIPNARTYVAVNGGMTDNPRFALYQARYDALLPERPQLPKDTTVTLAGRCCESGDLIARDIQLPPVQAGDLVCVLSTGAYNYSMASHYNRVPKPPVVMVSQGQDKLVLRRETLDDLLRNDMVID